jgi:hypothetical protein
MLSATLTNTTQHNQNLETYCLIWLDTSVNNSQENIQAQNVLRTTINQLLTFDDDQRFFQHIDTLSDDDRIVLIVSGRLGQTIVPQVCPLRQIVSIYIYCRDKEANKQWSQNFFKVNTIENFIFNNICMFEIGQRCSCSIRGTHPANKI